MNFLLSLDQFGCPIQLNLSGKSVHKTMVGTTFTALFYAIISYSFITELFLLMGTNSYLTTSTSNLSKNQVVQLQSSDISFKVQIKSQYNETILNYLSADLYYQKSQNEETNIPLNLTIKNNTLQIDISNSINKSKPFNFSQSQKFFMVITYDRVRANNSNFEDLQIDLNWISQQVNSDGRRKSFQHYTSTLTRSGNKLFQFKLQPMKIINKVFYNTKTEEAFKYSFSGEQYYFTSNKSIIAGVSAVLSEETTQYVITGPQYYDIIGKIGGIWQFFFLLFNYLVGPINKSLKNFEIMNSLFNFEYLSMMRSASDSIQLQRKIAREGDLQSTFGSPPNHQRLRNTLQGEQSYSKLESIKRNIKKAFSINSSNTNQRKTKTPRMTILKSLKDFYSETQKRHQLRYTQYLIMRLSCRKSLTRAKSQVEKAKIKVLNNLDVTFIIKKLTEIDKLKMLVLSEPQLKLFDYLPKPTIHLNEVPDSEQYWSLLKRDLNDVHRTIEAAKAYRLILQQCSSSINRRLVNMLDDPMKELFSVVDTQHSDEDAPSIQISRANLSNIRIQGQDIEQGTVPDEGIGIQLDASQKYRSKRNVSNFLSV